MAASRSLEIWPDRFGFTGSGGGGMFGAPSDTIERWNVLRVWSSSLTLLLVVVVVPVSFRVMAFVDGSISSGY